MVRRQPRLILLLAALALLALVASACRPVAAVGGAGGNGRGPKVTINQIQVLASHNSYHREPEPTLLSALKGFLGDAANGFEYTHRPLAEELDAGVRQVELDVFVDDPGGGRYAQPVLVPALGLDPVDPAMAEPGLKVFHVQEVDYRSTCPTFVECLTQLRAWSEDHPGHLPITIQIEAKDDTIPDPGLGFVQPLPWTGPDFGALEREIRAVFADSDIITPGDVKGRSRTLADAVRKGRWPTLREARDQVLFVLDDKGAKRDAYRAQAPDVDDRLIFVYVPADPRFGTGYVVDLPGDGAARCNPVNAPKRCTNADLGG